MIALKISFPELRNIEIVTEGQDSVLSTVSDGVTSV